MNTQFRIIPLGISDRRSEREEQMMKLLGAVKEALVHGQTAVFLKKKDKLDAFWEKAAKKENIRLAAIPIPKEKYGSGQSHTDNLNRDLILMSDMADLVLAFWDEDPDGAENVIWQTMHRCMEKRIPCIWISKKTGKVFWANQILYEPYQEAFLHDHCSGFSDGTPWDIKPRGFKLIQKIFLFGNWRYSRILKRIRIDSVSSGQKDTMIANGFFMRDTKAEAARRKLKDFYRLYDDRAVCFSKLYRGSVFFRASLPLISTIILAFAFYYGDFVKKFAPVGPFIDTANLVVGIFFLIQASLLLFSYLLEHPAVKSWHLNFLHNRIIAEILRFYIHILPYGITLPLSRLLSRSGFHRNNQSEFAVIHQLLRQAEEPFPTYREEEMKEYLNCLSAYLANQLDYHCAGAERYHKLSQRYSRLVKYVSYVSVTFVIVRGFVQFFLRLPFWEGVDFYRSVANMLAMVMPAIVAYYSGKRSLLGFEDSYAVDQAMKERLEKAMQLVDAMRDHDVNYSMMRNLAESVSELMLGNVSAWEQEMRKKKVSHL